MNLIAHIKRLISIKVMDGKWVLRRRGAGGGRVESLFFLPTVERGCQGDFDRIRHKYTGSYCISMAETREKMKQAHYSKKL